MDLYFVNTQDGETAHTRQERRNIRSHALRGRGGRKRRHAPQQVMRRCPPAAQKTFLVGHHPCQSADCHTVHFYLPKRPSLDMRQPIWDDLALVTLPYKLTVAHRTALHDCHRVIRQLLYPPAFCADTEGITTVWMRFAFEDEAYLQVAQAYTASFTSFFAGEPILSPRALGHLARAYALISERLSGPNSTSRSTIATVTSISLYQRLHHLQSLGRLHFEGLLRILALRGGMVQLAQDDRALALKPWGLDLEFALQDGEPVRFNRLHGPGPCLPLFDPSSCISGETMGRSVANICDAELHEIFLDMQHFVGLLNCVGETNKVDPLDYQQHAQYLLYRLLWLQSVGEAGALSLEDDLLHLTMVAVCITTLPEHGGQHKRFGLVSRKLRRALEYDASSRLPDLKVRLWALFVAGISVTNRFDDVWLLPSIKVTMRELQLYKWEAVRQVLGAFMWIGALHDVPGEKLFSASL